MFCALSTLCDQLLHDNTADIYHVVSLYHMKRPGVFSNKVCKNVCVVFSWVLSIYCSLKVTKESALFVNDINLAGS